MRICSLIKLSLNDYPGKVACTLFTGGCNLRCPFCHNAPLVLDAAAQDEILQPDFFAFLDKRRGILDGVCVSGGEPLLQPDLTAFIAEIKERGFAVKLDTNGTFPDKLKALCESGLIDYVAMDIKNAPAKYAETAGIENLTLDGVSASIRFLLSGSVDYEFRTTIVDELHTPQDMVEIGKWIHNAKRYFLAPFRDGESVIKSGLHAPAEAKMHALAAAVSPYVQQVGFRGI